MLLSMMRKHAKSWIIKVMIAVIVLVFVFYFGYGSKGDKRAKVAVVNGEIISKLEYTKAYRDLLTNLQNEYKSAWNDNLIKLFDLENRALESLIDEKILSQEAQKIGLEVTEEEIQQEVFAYPAFQNNGRFDVNRYRAVLSNNRMKPEDFEESISKSILQRKLQQFMMTFLPVSEQESLDYYNFSNQQMKIDFVLYSPEQFKDSVSVDQSAMEAYFEDHKEEYRIPEKVKISYITVDPTDFKDQVQISEEELQEYYEDNIQTYQEEKQVHARHILFELKPDATEEEDNQTKEKALSVLKEAREGKDFAELAKKYSEGPTKERGGDLGYFAKGRMVKTFEDAAFSLEKGEISEPVKSPFGYHLIKVEDIKEAETKAFEKVSEEIKNILIQNDSSNLANEKALTLIDQMPYDINLEEYAGEHEVTPGKTGFFSRNEPIPVIGGDQKLVQSIFLLEKMEISDLIEFNNKFYIIQVIDKNESYLPELKAVTEQVEGAFIQYLASLEGIAAGERHLKKLLEGVDWVELAKENNLEPVTTDYFPRQGSIQPIGYAPELQEAAFSLSEEKVYPEKVFTTDQGTYVIKWAETKEIDKEKYEEEKAQFKNSLTMTKLNAVFNDWLENLKAQAEIDRKP